MDFSKINTKKTQPELEEEILKFWQENKTFEKSIEIRENSEKYSFYDGPPFATGSPHYGHIVASTMKDVVPRYWTMRGYQVERKWGWDCHGLPIENIAEKELGITHKKQIEEMGVKKFNDVCRSKILGYVEEWEKVIPRLGRWVDMKNAYKTMDIDYMESVWWTFKELWDRGLIYEGYRAMHICPRCETTLSQSEVVEGYKDIKDLSLIAKFELIDEPETFVLAWTTTPWTLIGNVALAVGADINYSQINIDNADYIIAEDRIKDILKDKEYKVIKQFKGSDLVGKSYKPLFDYYINDDKVENKGHAWKIYAGNFVSTEEGTGIVHMAPAFGEDDLNLAKEKNLPIIAHIGMDGIIKSEAKDFTGLSVKPMGDVQATDKKVIDYLENKDLVFSTEQYEHSYPHCWRCETPLLNYATSSWFVKVTDIKDKAIKLAKNIHWSPAHLKQGRFGKWLEGARDWSISRQRYWASVIPIWKCNQCSELEVFGSIADLEKVSGQKVTDLHKDVVDEVTYKCLKCDGTMQRIPDVLDTWFDSGSMPYAQKHYPFENKETFENSFPAEFIAEGVDQTRAWFYYLHIIASAIKEKQAYENVIVNGIVLAEDGKKMAKRLQNYPDPMEMFHEFGADAVRYYLLSSSVVSAENLNFTKKDVAEISRGMFRMLWNTYTFFVMYAVMDNWHPGQKNASDNILDKWIISNLNKLIDDVNNSMEKYELMKASRYFASFIDDLSNWYLRRSRKRFKSNDQTDKDNAYASLYYVLTTLTKLMAPFTPFITEEIYKNLTGEESVHLTDYPQANKEDINIDLTDQMTQVRKLIEIGLAHRADEKIRVRQPLASATIKTKIDEQFLEIIKEELNVKEIKVQENIETDIILDTKLTTDLQVEGIKNDLMRAIQDLRKKAGYTPRDKVTLYYQTDNDQNNIAIEQYNNIIKEDTNLADIINEKKADIDSEIDINGFWLGVKR